METPELGPGDMLLMRFNVIHATQSKDRKWIHPIEAVYFFLRFFKIQSNLFTALAQHCRIDMSHSEFGRVKPV